MTTVGDCDFDLNECNSAQYLPGQYDYATVGCLDPAINPATFATCAESSTVSVPLAARQCTCAPGKFVDTGATSDITVAVQVLAVGSSFLGCNDIAECISSQNGYDPTIHGCTYLSDSYPCAEGTAGTSRLLNFRSCTCDVGSYYTGSETPNTDITQRVEDVMTGVAFQGCTDINECIQGSQTSWDDTLYACMGTNNIVYTCAEGIIADIAGTATPNYRYCSCPIGEMVDNGANDVTLVELDVMTGTTFPGCTDINECAPGLPTDMYGCADTVMTDCVESSTDTSVSLDYRRCTCPVGYYALDSASVSNPVRVVDIQARTVFQGCEDVDECSLVLDTTQYGCEDLALPTGLTITCADSISSSGAIALDVRQCTCPTGFYAVQAGTPVAVVEVDARTTFTGCLDIDECMTTGGYGCASTYNLNSILTICSDSLVDTSIAYGEWTCECPVGSKIIGEATGVRSKTYNDPSAGTRFPGCALDCGDGLVRDSELCDDGNDIAHDGCFACDIEVGWTCQEQTTDDRSICDITCGDGLVITYMETPPAGIVWETCDDAGKVVSDGCSDVCQVEYGFYCPYDTTLSRSVCNSQCGDGKLVERDEDCDDGDNAPNDGCDATCNIESGWFCVTSPGEPSQCGDVNECADASLCVDPQLGRVRCESDTATVPGLLPGHYHCTCPPGYLVRDQDPERQTIDLVRGGSSFPGCFDVDECARYGCTRDYTLACDNQINQRTCTCRPGTEEAGEFEVLIGNEMATLTCTDIRECDIYPCGTFLNKPIPCAEVEINSRVCTCPDFLTGSDTLVGDTPFKGCAILISVAAPTTLGYTLSNGYWNDWSDFLIADLDQDPNQFEDIWYSTKSTGEIGWLANKRANKNSEPVFFTCPCMGWYPKKLPLSYSLSELPFKSNQSG